MKPLDGIRVLDMSRVLAGPFAGRILSDLGAEVVKLEPPEGDITRNWGKVRAGLAGFYTQQNVGKSNVCVDLRCAGGPDLVKQLAAQAHVLIENFRPGVMSRYGLSYEELAKLNPSLVMVSISGFGQEGPESQRAAYAPILHGESGWIRRSADWNSRPMEDMNLSVADTNASLHGTIGVLAALRTAEMTGQGQHIDIAMLDAFLATDDASHNALDDVPYNAQGGLVWQATGGQILTAGDFRWVWRCLAQTHGLSDGADQDADLDTKRRLRTQAIETFLQSFETREEVTEAFDKAGLAWGNLNTTAQAYETPTAQHRNSSVEIDARDGGTRRVAQTPYRFSAAESGITPSAVAPHRGEHNSVVLSRWLGTTDQEVTALVEAGVLLVDKSVL